MAGLDRSDQILAVAILFFVLSWVTVGLRVYVKRWMLKAFGPDDTTMLVTLFFYTIYLICQLGGVAHGTGKHRSQLSDHDAQIALTYWFFCEIFYTISTSVLKIAIGLFLLRFAVERTHVWIIRAIMGASVVVGFVFAVVILFQCHPISYWWDLNPDASGRCIDPDIIANMTYVVSALNSAADWVFGILPIFMVKKLQMKAYTKAVVALLLGFAAIGSTATIIRMPYIYTIRAYKGDFLYRTTDVALWTTVEVGVGISAGCIATLRPLIQRFLDLIGLNTTADGTSRDPRTKSVKKSQTGKSQGKGTYRSNSQSLDELHFGGDKETTTTTITAKAKKRNDGLSWAEVSRSGSEDEIVSGMPSKSHNLETGLGGISKVVDITIEDSDTTAQQQSTGDADMEQSLLSKPASIYARI